ncbi:nuclear transport factor 2 family protein [Brevibacterium oceani]|uniref:nuclear transport factor 2 family protein n=1 Tax=Brevibacterium oceani TaxID=358099 RepID=UPI001B33C4DA|nr:nuclear transport factor 2 family protein [Brevibacterium oceani]
MTLTTDDQLNVIGVISLHGHLCDANALDRLDEVFTPDLVLDVSELGRPALPNFDPARSLEAYIAAGKRSGPGTTVGMHATNIIVREAGSGAHAVSKGFTVDTSGTTSSFTYTDRLVRTDDGWRISHRRISPRREPGRGPEPTFEEHE